MPFCARWSTLPSRIAHWHYQCWHGMLYNVIGIIDRIAVPMNTYGMGTPRTWNARNAYISCHYVDMHHDDVIKWKHFPRNWPFVRGIHRYPVNSLHKGQWRRALMFSLICVWINDWVNNRDAGGLRRYRAHYDVILMILKNYNIGWCYWLNSVLYTNFIQKSFHLMLMFDWSFRCFQIGLSLRFLWYVFVYWRYRSEFDKQE